MDLDRQEYNMRLEIKQARPIKPMVLRFSLLHYDNENNLAGEYEIAVDIEPYLTYQTQDNNNVQINIDVTGIQQYLTDAVAEMQITGMIAVSFTGIDWVVGQNEENLIESKADEKELPLGLESTE